MVRTTRGRVSTFGPYNNPEDGNYELCNLSNGPIFQLIHDDPEARDPILYFGAHCRPAGNVSQPRPLKHIEVPDERVEYEEFFHSHISLKDVEQVRIRCLTKYLPPECSKGPPRYALRSLEASNCTRRP